MCKLKLAGYRLYYLSNIPQDVIDEIRQRDFSRCLTAALPRAKYT